MVTSTFDPATFWRIEDVLRAYPELSMSYAQMAVKQAGKPIRMVNGAGRDDIEAVLADWKAREYGPYRKSKVNQ